MSTGNVTMADVLAGSILGLGCKFERLDVVRKTVKNWPEVLLFWFRLKKKVTMQMNNERGVTVSSIKEFLDFWRSDRGQRIILGAMGAEDVEINSGIATFRYNNQPIKMKLGLGLTIVETFMQETYKEMDVRNRDVVDIGANIGDTALYFSFRGAKRVVGFEPYPYSFKIANQNLELNNLSRRIRIVCAAVGGKSGSIRINPKYQNRATDTLITSSRGVRVPILTLDQIIRKYGIWKNAALKIDCEGCEYDILLNTPISTLKHFSEIMLEYHYGYLDIKKKLEDAGFVVSVSRPRKDMLAGYLGFLHAKR